MAQEVAGAERRALALNDALKAGGAAKVDTIEHLNAIRQLRRNGRELHRSGVLFQGDLFLTLFPCSLPRIRLGTFPFPHLMMLHQAGIRPEDRAAGRITPPKLHNLTNALTSLARRPLWVRCLLQPLTLWPCSRTSSACGFGGNSRPRTCLSWRSSRPPRRQRARRSGDGE